MLIVSLAAAALSSAPAPAFAEKPCTDDRIVDVARCGSVIVPEDRDRPEGRTISLNVVVLPAMSEQSPEHPIFEIDGGPGLPVTKNAEFYATFGSAYRANRDIVLVDQRGTGASGPLNCPELADPEKAYEPVFPIDAVERCRAALEGSADLTKYGTREAVADLDEVRKALGYEKINLFALSYGTTVALRYLAAHPSHVRSAVLMGVSPPSSTPPKSHATAGQRALDLLTAQCRADPACSASFDPAADIAQVSATLPETEGAPAREIFFEKLRSLMYLPMGARMVPYILNRAARGDLEPFYLATRPRGPSPFSDGMFLSVICSEAIAQMDLAAARQTAKATVFGDYRLRRQAEACPIWPVADVEDDFLTPVSSDVPVLLVSGEWDPVTPPALADEVAGSLANAKHVIIPGSGHIFDGMTGIETCLDPLMLSFVDSAQIATVDATCVAEMKPPAFMTSLPEALGGND